MRLASSGVIGRLLASRDDASHVRERLWQRNDPWNNYLGRTPRSRQADAMAGQQCREAVVGEKRVLLLAQGGERIEPLQFGIDEAGMTHHQAAVGQPVEEA